MFRKNLIISIVSTSLILVSCAEEQPPIDRVQPDYFPKSFFVGADLQSTQDDPEFYSQGTLVDVGYGAGQDGLFTSTYAQPLSRIRWSIEQNLLVARLAYERIAGTDGKGVGKGINDGIVVAAYAITRHFDIDREYNPTTGERLNVRRENDVDRPWYEREYIRVDWSRNLSTANYDFDTLSMLGIYGGVKYSPLSYYVNDPNSEDAPHYEPGDGYLDITNKAFAEPQMINLSHLGWGIDQIPACWLDSDFAGGSAPTTGCSPVELTIRHSFRKVPKTDYEPIDWDGNRFQSFGAFDVERKGYARNYGMTDTQWHRFINRYNIWERHHYYTDAKNMVGAVECNTPKTTRVGENPNRDLKSLSSSDPSALVMGANGTADECEQVGRGSQCDTFNQKCTLPFRDRKPSPIVWYHANGSNDNFFDATDEATHEWDVAMRSSIQAARYAECARANDSESCVKDFPVYRGQQDDNENAVALAREVDDCRRGRAYAGRDCLALADEIGNARGYSAGVIALAKMDEAIVLCHSPVQTNDHELCATKGRRLPAKITAAQCNTAYESGSDKGLIETCKSALNVRRGDLRYHQVNSIKTPQTPSPWGIMVDAHDPLTGETVAASINVWTHINDIWSQGVVDVARYIKGELSTADVTEGTYVRDWAQAADAATRNGAVSSMTEDNVSERVASLTGTNREALKRLESQLDIPELSEQIQAIKTELKHVRAEVSANSVMRPVYEARRKRVLGSATEAALMTPMMQELAGVKGLANSNLSAEFSSPFRGNNPSVARELRHRKESALAERGACIMNEAPAPVAMADLSDLLEAKFGKFQAGDSKDAQSERAERMRRYLAHKAHYAVVTHEMGHSIGLRHNFVSSADAFNFRPQYWQLRTDNGSNVDECTDLKSDGSCIGPRYFDPVTENERKNLITMFMQSSTMDYAGEATQDLLGLGAYDFAAARMFYGDVTAVYAEGKYRVGTPLGTGILEKLDNFGGIIGIQASVGVGSSNRTTDIHYSALQKNYDLISNCKVVNPLDYKPARWNEDSMGQWHPLLDGLFVQVGGQYTRCQQPYVDYVAWQDLRMPTAKETSNTRSSVAVDGMRRIRVPYGFGTDNWADLGNLSVYRHDNGADPYELFDFLITQQEINHVFDNYRRNRHTFTVRGAAFRQLSRYNEKLRDAAKGLGLMANVYRNFAESAGYDYESLWPYIGNLFFKDNLLASGIAFDHFTKQLARPAAGPHFLSDVGGSGTGRILRSSTDSTGNPGPTVVNIPNGATGFFGNVAAGGRPLENALAQDQGEYNSQFTINAGSYYEKVFTSMLMTESVDNFISASRQDFLDARYRSVSLADLFPDGYRRWLANNLTDDDELKAPRLAANAFGIPAVNNEKFPQQTLGWISWAKTTPEACFPGKDSLLCSTSPANTVGVDPQIGWEQQKFLIAWTLAYLPENQQQTWLNQLGIWELGADTNPDFQNRIELHLPDGKTYIAKTYGKETIFGKTVQKGVAARILEYANQLLNDAYVTTNGPDLDGDLKPDWYLPTVVGGKPVVKFDSNMKTVRPNGTESDSRPGCNSSDNSQCTCSSNRACLSLQKYQQVPFFMRQAMRDFGMPGPWLKGVF